MRTTILVFDEGVHGEAGLQFQSCYAALGWGWSEGRYSTILNWGRELSGLGAGSRRCTIQYSKAEQNGVGIRTAILNYGGDLTGVADF